MSSYVTVPGLVTTLAGSSDSGYVDGQSAVAKFDTPTGIAVDSQGVVFVAETRNRAIRVVKSVVIGRTPNK